MNIKFSFHNERSYRFALEDLVCKLLSGHFIRMNDHAACSENNAPTIAM